ncbi:MAG: NAD(P)H-hydrate epimerase [Candidatus Dormibacteria bacterium]
MSNGEAASSDQARALDAAAGRLGISQDALMAIASWQCARLALDILGKRAAAGPIAVLAGKGNNGGDALGCARHLAAWGRQVRSVTLGEVAESGTSYARQVQAAQAAGVELRPVGHDADATLDWALGPAGLVVDGLLGTGSVGAARGLVARVVRHINASAALVLAIDVPSGLDATTGIARGDCVRADATVMLAVAKLGCLAPSAPVGELWLADIGVPSGAYSEVGLEPPSWSGGSLRQFQPASERDTS